MIAAPGTVCRHPGSNVFSTTGNVSPLNADLVAPYSVPLPMPRAKSWGDGGIPGGPPLNGEIEGSRRGSVGASPGADGGSVFRGFARRRRCPGVVTSNGTGCAITSSGIRGGGSGGGESPRGLSSLCFLTAK